MDRTPQMLAAYAVLADLRRAGGSAGNHTTPEPNSLLEMLMNPEFINPNLRASDEVRRDDPSVYDDLPPLEDEAGTRLSRAAANAPPPDTEMQPLEEDEDDGPPPLEPADHLRSRSPSPATTAPPPHILSGASPSVRLSDLVRIVHDPTPEVRRPARTTTSAAQPEDDAGNESDSSLPSLQSVSDSSDEEDVFMDDSDSDWDDEESLSYSDDETNLVAQMIETAERNHARNGPAPLHLAESINIEPEADFDPLQLTSNTQLYRELLERASNVIPDLPSRFRPPPPWVTDLTRLAGVDNDPERAETLLAAMEVVSDDLVRRYEKLRTGDGEDVDGCAICRDDLLAKSAHVEHVPEVLAMLSALPFHQQDCIVAFPCAGKHLFHRDCLSPWLARKTTCPTCRFDIDPLSLTLQISRGIDDPATELELEEEHPSRVWQHPEAESMSDWISAEEQAQASGIPRQRPAVRMPEYPPLPPRTVTDSAHPAPRRPVRPPGNSFLAELLRFESAAFDTTDPLWNFRAETEIVQMQQVHRDTDARVQNAGTGVPARSPSAPAVPPSEASPPMAPSNPPSPPPHPSLGQHPDEFLYVPVGMNTQWDPVPAITSLRRNMLDLLRRQPQPRSPPEDAPWRTAPSASSTDVPRSAERVPSALRGLDVDALNAPRHSEGVSDAIPVAAPAFIRMPASAVAGSSSEMAASSEDSRARNGQTAHTPNLGNLATAYMELMRNRLELFPDGAGAFSPVLTRHTTPGNASQGSRTPSTSHPPAAPRPSEAPSSQDPSASTDEARPSTGYNPADDLD
ncbi:hypothetical protein OH76DRAFT_1479882 [Lentinus brumalis]|uniref:RING-type domain-containing protein n=1 Tax=Lentinus brumalis TaxID=2498619 RepID=A0A371DLP5_9APHY|nr:hypothetical protein OH76DRAFT_1479882 [Polyporus brumalis]